MERKGREGGVEREREIGRGRYEGEKGREKRGKRAVQKERYNEKGRRGWNEEENRRVGKATEKEARVTSRAEGIQIEERSMTLEICIAINNEAGGAARFPTAFHGNCSAARVHNVYNLYQSCSYACFGTLPSPTQGRVHARSPGLTAALTVP